MDGGQGFSSIPFANKAASSDWRLHKIEEYPEIHTFNIFLPLHIINKGRYVPLLCVAVHQCHDVADMAKAVDVLHGIPHTAVLREEGAGLGGAGEGKGAVDKWQVGS